MRFKYLVLLSLIATAAIAGPRFDARLHEAPTSRFNPICRPHLSTLDDDSLHKFNVLKFEAHLNFNFDSTIISGYIVSRLVTDQLPLGRIDLRLSATLAVDSVWCDGGHTATFTRTGVDSIQVLLNPQSVLNETLRVGIAYHGQTREADDFGGMFWRQQSGWQPQIAYSMGEALSLDPPPATFLWMPCFSDPNDKVLWESWLRTPANRVACSNGLRIDTLQEGNWVTWHYRIDQPISTYLISVAISDYTIMVQRESNPRIENFVYPNRVAEAQIHFANQPAVLDGFAARFGAYQFDRFGNVMCRVGDMEHATCVSHADWTVQGNHNYDWLIFHEMSHHWWGDWVTCATWKDLWLNEGFATWCEAVGMEVLGGRQAYHDYFINAVFPDVLDTEENFPIYDPDFYWGVTVYNKGGCVMYMLRELMGDTTFFQALREYGNDHAFANATTAEWQAKLEQHYGGSLDWFFQPWVYGVKYPQYHVSYGVYNDSTYVGIQQTQVTQTLFTMPIEIRVFHDGGETFDTTVWNQPNRNVQYYFPHGVTHIDSVIIDPDDKILKLADYNRVNLAAGDSRSDLPTDFQITSIFPNPFNPSATLTFDLPHNAPVTLRVFDLLGREVFLRNLGTQQGGTHSIIWDGSPHASGIYLFGLETPEQQRFSKAILLK